MPQNWRACTDVLLFFTGIFKVKLLLILMLMLIPLARCNQARKVCEHNIESKYYSPREIVHALHQL